MGWMVNNQRMGEGKTVIKQTMFLAAVLLGVSPVWAVNKCTGPDGKVVYQDAVCAGKGEAINISPASGHAAPSAAPAQAAPAGGPRPALSKEGVFGASWQRRTFLESRGVPDARSALQGHLQRCAAKQRELTAKKGSASNNLAGATWEQSISTEMQAVATMCDSQGRDLRAQVEALEKELRELQATR